MADVGGGVMRSAQSDVSSSVTSLKNVTFEPGCRNNWHIHHKQVQVLICVAGRGWYQEWGKAPVEMTPGTVIAVPAEVKHWHGAQKDSWFQHLTYHKDVQKGAGNEWCEPVDNAFIIFVVLELYLLRFRIFNLQLNMLTLGRIQTSLFLLSLTRIFNLYNLKRVSGQFL